MDFAAQNYLFNIFKGDALEQALSEMYRVAKPNGRLVLSDPVCETKIPTELLNDERLRALCLSGGMPSKEYIEVIADVGFGTIEIWSKLAYCILDPSHYNTSNLVYI